MTMFGRVLFLAVAMSGEAVEEKKDLPRIRLRVREVGSEALVPCRVHLKDATGKARKASGLPFWHDHFVCPGEAVLDVEAGVYRYTIERGPEYRRASGEVRVEGGKNAELEVRIERRVDLAARGWWSGETHVHRSPDEMPLHMRAEDLHAAPLMTVWNKRNLWKERQLPAGRLVEVEPGRAYHILAAEDERQGGALLYFGLERPLNLEGNGPEHPSPLVHLEEALSQPGAWAEIEKPFWWDVPVWAATGKISSIGIANNHMCRSQMYENEAWGRSRDAVRLPPPRGNGFHSQEIYYRLLNCGLRIPPSAGSASGVLPNPVGYNRVYVKIEGAFSWGKWWAGLAAGRSFVTNGPILLVEADGKLPGHVFRSPNGPLSLQLDLQVLGNDPIEAVEILQDGRIAISLAPDALRGAPPRASIEFAKSGWFLVRAIAKVPETFRFASTAPFYVEIEGKPSTIRRDDVDYFLTWIDERIARINKAKSADLKEPGRREAIIETQRNARRYFEGLREKSE